MGHPARFTEERIKLFVREYLKDLNGTQAAIRAGWSKGTAPSSAYHLLAREDVQDMVREANAERLERAEVSADMVLKQLIALSTVDIASAFDEHGVVKQLHEMPPETRAALAGIEAYEEYAGRGADREPVGRVTKIKLMNKLDVLELLGRHLSLFNDKMQISGPDNGPVQIDDGTRAARIAAILAAGARRRADGSDLV
jgi:phage terminase small subunit